jgi:uncharacterized iron-regulated protein
MTWLKICTYSLLMLLLAGSPVLAQQITQITMNGQSQAVTRENVLKTLGAARVIYLGETHDSVQDHQAQLEIIQALHRQNPRLVIGLEMFQRPFQPVLDRYVRGELTEVELLEQSEYTQRWGFSWQLYAPIIRFAKEHQLPLIALNTPTEVTRKVARNGLTGLAAADWQFIPPLAEIDLNNQAYRRQVEQSYQAFHHGGGQGSSGGQPTSRTVEHFWQAQVLWDETMAAATAQALKSHPNRQMVVLAGSAHIAHGYGIPSRVARRLGSKPGFRQYSVLLNPDASLRQGRSADFWWINHGQK